MARMLNSKKNSLPLILVLVFITFFSHVLGRHRFRHYRDRFKRQFGANMYIPGSFVTEGGEGPDEGPWSEWSSPSPCSRDCGGGVSSQYRECQQGYTCRGPSIKHFSCNTQDCDRPVDSRAEQCSEFNNVPFEGVYYTWVPYTKAPNQCELNCMPRGERFYFKHRQKVTDGTRCNDESLDVCVDGKCQPVGCDMMLGSYAREDQCRVCGGDGSTCNTVQGLLNMQDLKMGYNDILLIPAGATNILVEEVAESNNYLAVRNASFFYHLNGNWRIDFPRTLDFAGTNFHYERFPQGFPAPDRITCLGPTEENLYISLLMQEPNVGVKYEYSVPKNIVPGENETYVWTFDAFTPCSVSCGGGIQYRNVSCVGRKRLEPVDRSLCDANSEPPTSERCNEIPCEAQWVPYPWSPCSSPCGEQGGVQSRQVLCQQIIAGGYPTPVDDSLCSNMPKPVEQQVCNQGANCASWHIGPWKPCDHLCGDGIQTRKVTCFRKDERKIEVLHDSECLHTEQKPETLRPCNVRPCEGVDWVVSAWSGCDISCGPSNKTRKVYCASESGQIYGDELCPPERKPETLQECKEEEAVCQSQWYASQWSECSVKCGEGVQTRTLFCGEVAKDGSVKKIDSSKCNNDVKYETVKPCIGKLQQCPGEWFTGPWTKCSTECGGGEKTRKVLCIKDEEVADPSECGSDEIAFAQESCNTHSCSDDTIISVDVTSPIKESESTEGVTSAEATSTTQEFSTSELTKSSEPPSSSSQTTLTSEETSSSEVSKSSSDVTLSSEASKSSSASESSESTSEATSDKPGDDGEYEIVPSETCDDGEWVDEDELADEGLTSPAEQNDDPLTLDDLMLSDMTSPGGDALDGSGDGSSTTSDSTASSLSSDITDTTIEGSGDTSSTKIQLKLSDIGESEGGRKGSTVSTTEFTGSTESTTEFTGSTESTTEFTGSTESTTEFTGSTESTTEFTGSTESTTEFTGSTESTTEFTGSTESTTEFTGSTESTTEFTGSTESTTEFTGSTESTTEFKGSTESTTEFTGSTESKTEFTGSTESTTEFTGSTESTTEFTGSTESTTEFTGSTESTTEFTGSTESTTEFTGSTESTTEFTGSTESTTEFTGSTESTTEFTGTTESTTEFTGSTESTTEFTGSTESTTEFTGSTESTTEFTGSTESTTEFTGSTESTTEFTGSTESTTEFTGSTESTTEFTGSTESTTEFTGSTESTTEFTGSTESTIEFTGSTESTTEFTGSTESTTEFTGSTESTTEFTGSTESTTEFTGSTESTTEFTGSTESTTEFTGSTESTTEFTGSTESTTEFTGSTESTTEFTGSTESTTEFTGSTESTTEFTGSTITDIWASSTESGGTSESSSSLYDIFKTTPKLRMCKRRKIKKCQKSEFGCCWDQITPAKGPFDDGCPTPSTCKESKFGCCEDEVSAALGPKFAGCPPTHCEETLFGCCSDERTAAEGPDNEGCPPECLRQKYGCCDDNITAAEGPHHKGCPEETTTPLSTTSFSTEEYSSTTPGSTVSPGDCLASTYGCCPDNVTAAEGEYFKGCSVIKEPCQESYWRCCPDGKTPAEGPNYRGCEVPCASSTFGCCPDGATPAHGYGGEGCCIQSPFGCCPDDITPARGLNKEGCECSYSSYGCCPDNVTAAKGYNKEGCGCQYTETGCCPDGVSPAQGPDYQGCSCNTYQFGCCSDGVTAAAGPYEQGCGCSVTEFGCCPDEKTPAQGPNGAGCGCESSKYECCPDGITEAKGENFEGCQDIPVNRQQSCGLPNERGTCRDYTVKWYYDVEYGGCSRFWYGGCDGNDNRFNSQEECEDVCVHPKGTDKCKLPKIPGGCAEYFPMWYYDSEKGYCSQFAYGGCLGNNNRFETSEECSAVCGGGPAEDPCEQPKEEGPCHGQFGRWFFDKSAGKCQEFNYGGCKGNNNNFASEQACTQKCILTGKKKDLCSLPKTEGECSEKLARWYYDSPESRCKPFYYTGCGGNENSFGSIGECEVACPKEIAKDMCHLPASIGECGNYVEKWYFDTKEKSCRQFYYGGCGGNDNRFDTQEVCLQSCKTTSPVPGPVTTRPPTEPFRTEYCFLPSETGDCRAAIQKYYYDKADGTCKSFIYGGCNGNPNNFDDVDTCLQNCGNSQDLCQLPPVFGQCGGQYEQYYYDSRTDSCQSFTFSGCGGNYNRFSDKESCEQRCRTTPLPVTEPRQPPQPTQPQYIPGCYEPADSGNCTDAYLSYYFDYYTQVCTPFTYTGCGGNDNRYNSRQECEQRCGQPVQQDVCSLQVDPGPCRDYMLQFYYNRDTQTCSQFTYGGCQGNDNRFNSYQECEDRCVAPYRPQQNTTPPVIIEPHPCQAYFDECPKLRCPYGIEAYVDETECNRCRCLDPCSAITCPEDTQCAIDINRNRTTSVDPNFIAVCRQVYKAGNCPILQKTETNCFEECRTDADCQLDLKCCSTGCGHTCASPGQIAPGRHTQKPLPAYTPRPVEQQFRPPQVIEEEYQPVSQGELGGYAILKCAVSGNPNPRISWSKDNLIIDGSQPRFRIRLDQSLQIITLHRTDSGIYLCTADNDIGDPIVQEIKLDVVDAPERPATVLDVDEQPSIIASLNAPATLNCYALGYPFPTVTWWKDDSLIPLHTREFEVRKDYSLVVHSVQLENLGIYTCQAYNGIGKAASWSVTVQAKGPYYSTDPKDQQYLKYIINTPSVVTTGGYVPTRPPLPPYPLPFTNPQRVTRNPFVGPGEWREPVRANISTTTNRFPVSGEVRLPCFVQGYPPPNVTWYKDGTPLEVSERVHISGGYVLTIFSADKSDSGMYECEAVNDYGKSSSAIAIRVEGMYVDPSCTDNPFFANCELIVRAKYCSHKYYAKFCCRSCTEAGQLPVNGPHLQNLTDRQSALRDNLIEDNY